MNSSESLFTYTYVRIQIHVCTCTFVKILNEDRKPSRRDIKTRLFFRAYLRTFSHWIIGYRRDTMGSAVQATPTGIRLNRRKSRAYLQPLPSHAYPPPIKTRCTQFEYELVALWETASRIINNILADIKRQSWNPIERSLSFDRTIEITVNYDDYRSSYNNILCPRFEFSQCVVEMIFSFLV